MESGSINVTPLHRPSVGCRVSSKVSEVGLAIERNVTFFNRSLLGVLALAATPGKHQNRWEKEGEETPQFPLSSACELLHLITCKLSRIYPYTFKITRGS